MRPAAGQQRYGAVRRSDAEPELMLARGRIDRLRQPGHGDPPGNPRNGASSPGPAAQRSRATSAWPAFSASYTAPCPRRCPATSGSAARSRTGPPARGPTSLPGYAILNAKGRNQG